MTAPDDFGKFLSDEIESKNRSLSVSSLRRRFKPYRIKNLQILENFKSFDITTEKRFYEILAKSTITRFYQIDFGSHRFFVYRKVF